MRFRLVMFATSFAFLLFAAPAFAAGSEVPAAPLLPPEAVSALVTVLISAILSGIASGFNAFLRAQRKRGKKSGPAVLAMGAGLNAIAFNFDQAGRQAKAATGKPAVTP